eukprot:jgi/Botrbrau1/23192/Bobra.0041s0039.1
MHFHIAMEICKSPDGKAESKKRRLALLHQSARLPMGQFSGGREDQRAAKGRGTPRGYARGDRRSEQRPLSTPSTGDPGPLDAHLCYSPLPGTRFTLPLMEVAKPQEGGSCGEVLASFSKGASGVSNNRQAMVRLQDRVLLLDNPAQALKRHQRQGGGRLSQKLLSRSKLKSLGLGPKWQRPERAEDLAVLKNLWEKSLEVYLAGPQKRVPGEPPPLMLGCPLRVDKGKNSCHVGLEGTVIADTPRTLGLLLPNNKVRIVAKTDSLFRTRRRSDDIIIDGSLLVPVR